MDRNTWIEWTRTRLDAAEVGPLLALLSETERSRLEDAGWVWQPGQVIWLDPSGELRRGRFTHGRHIQTRKGELYIDSQGTPHVVREANA